MVDSLRQESDKAERPPHGCPRPSHANCTKSAAHGLTLLAIVDRATTCVVRLESSGV